MTVLLGALLYLGVGALYVCGMARAGLHPWWILYVFERLDKDSYIVSKVTPGEVGAMVLLWLPALFFSVGALFFAVLPVLIVRAIGRLMAVVCPALREQNKR